MDNRWWCVRSSVRKRDAQPAWWARAEQIVLHSMWQTCRQVGSKTGRQSSRSTDSLCYVFALQCCYESAPCGLVGSHWQLQYWAGYPAKLKATRPGSCVSWVSHRQGYCRTHTVIKVWTLCCGCAVPVLTDALQCQPNCTAADCWVIGPQD